MRIVVDRVATMSGISRYCSHTRQRLCKIVLDLIEGEQWPASRTHTRLRSRTGNSLPVGSRARSCEGGSQDGFHVHCRQARTASEMVFFRGAAVLQKNVTLGKNRFVRPEVSLSVYRSRPTIESRGAAGPMGSIYLLKEAAYSPSDW